MGRAVGRIRQWNSTEDLTPRDGSSGVRHSASRPYKGRRLRRLVSPSPSSVRTTVTIPRDASPALRWRRIARDAAGVLPGAEHGMGSLGRTAAPRSGIVLCIRGTRGELTYRAPGTDGEGWVILAATLLGARGR